MHIDLAHALVTGVIVLMVMQVFRKAGWADGKHIDWRQVLVITVAIFILNLAWPW